MNDVVLVELLFLNQVNDIFCEPKYNPTLTKPSQKHVHIIRLQHEDQWGHKRCPYKLAIIMTFYYINEDILPSQV